MWAPFLSHFLLLFYTFLCRTSDGNEHLVNPEDNYATAEEAIQGLLDFFEEKGVSDALDLALGLIFDASLDDVHTLFSDFFHSAYFNYLGDSPVMPDDAIEIQLTK